MWIDYSRVSQKRALNREMVFGRYFLERFFKAFAIIVLALAVVVNLIEFFEKLTRTNQTNLGHLVEFLSFNFLPSCLQLFPIAAWLASCVIIREFFQHKEWDALFLLTIAQRPLLRWCCVAGAILMSVGCLLHETVGISLAQRSKMVKSEKLKHESVQTVSNYWGLLDRNCFCHVHFLDYKVGRGENIMIFSRDQEGMITTAVSCDTFLIDHLKQSITLPKAQVISYVDQDQPPTYICMTNLHYHAPNLFVQAQLTREALSLVSLVNIFSRTFSSLSHALKYDLINTIAERIIFCLHLFMYPVIVFMLFFIWYHSLYAKWCVILMPYPAVIILQIMSSLIHSAMPNVWFLGFQVIICIMLCGIFFRKLL